MKLSSLKTEVVSLEEQLCHRLRQELTTDEPTITRDAFGDHIYVWGDPTAVDQELFVTEAFLNDLSAALSASEPIIEARAPSSLTGEAAKVTTASLKFPDKPKLKITAELEAYCKAHKIEIQHQKHWTDAEKKTETKDVTVFVGSQKSLDELVDKHWALIDKAEVRPNPLSGARGQALVKYLHQKEHLSHDQKWAFRNITDVVHHPKNSSMWAKLKESGDDTWLILTGVYGVGAIKFEEQNRVGFKVVVSGPDKPGSKAGDLFPGIQTKFVANGPEGHKWIGSIIGRHFVEKDEKGVDKDKWELFDEYYFAQDPRTASKLAADRKLQGKTESNREKKKERGVVRPLSTKTAAVTPLTIDTIFRRLHALGVKEPEPEPAEVPDPKKKTSTFKRSGEKWGSGAGALEDPDPKYKSSADDKALKKTEEKAYNFFLTALTNAFADARGMLLMMVKNSNLDKKSVEKMKHVEGLKQAIEDLEFGRLKLPKPGSSTYPFPYNFLRKAVEEAVDTAAHHFYPKNVSEGTQRLMNDIASGDQKKLAMIVYYFKHALLGRVKTQDHRR